MAKSWREVQLGRLERAQTRAGAARLDYGDVYFRYGQDFDLNEQEFRFKAIRPDFGNVWLDGLVVDASWTDEGGSSFNNPVTLTGQMSLRRPGDGQSGSGLNLEDGHEIACFVKWPGVGKSAGGIAEPGFMHLWTMRIQSQEEEVAEGAWTLQLADDTLLLRKSRQDWAFKKKKKGRYKRGWRMDQIVRHVAERYRFPVKTVKGTAYVKGKEFKDESPMAVIQWAVRHEARMTGVPLIIRWDAGKLVIEKARRNPFLYTFGDLLTTATVSRSNPSGQGLATAMTVRFTSKSKKDGRKKTAGKKERVYVGPSTSRAAEKLAKRYGYIHRQFKPPQGVDSKAEARDWARGVMLEKSIKVPTVSFSHPGIATCRKGDAVRLSIPDHGFHGIEKGDTGVAFIRAVQHRVSSGDYTMDVELTFKDMLDPEILKKMRDKALREKRKRERDVRKED